MSHVDDGMLHALVDGALDATERRVVEAHLATCAACTQRVTDATAMARDVTALLGTLDVAAPVVTPTVVATTAVASPVVRSMRPNLITLRRLAVAASVLLVASVSYEIGRRDDQATVSSTRFPAVTSREEGSRPAVASSAAPETASPAPAAAATALRARPRDASGAGTAPERTEPDRNTARIAAPAVTSEATAAAPPPPAAIAAPPRLAERRAPLNSVVVTGATAGPPAADAAVASAPAATKSLAVVPLRDAARVLDGYTMVDEESVPARTRRRYVSPSGTELLLTIVYGGVDQSRVAVGDAPEYTVVPSKNRSTVRWSARGADYTLEGAVTPDSLIKLAAALR